MVFSKLQLAERPLGGVVSQGDVSEVEMAMGRLGDEEELLVQRRDEERTAAAMANAFRHETRTIRTPYGLNAVVMLANDESVDGCGDVSRLWG